MKRFLHLLLMLLPYFLTAAASDTDSLRWEVSASQSLSEGSHTPFWLISNLHGLGSERCDFGFIRASLTKNTDTGERFSWGAGIDIVGAWRSEAPFQIHQLYAEIRWRSLGLLAGAREIAGELNDPRLSSGNLLFSGNAMPIPQVRAGIPEFTDFWGTGGWLAVKGYIAYGKFTDSEWQSSWSSPGSRHTAGVLFHSKGLWLRGGKTAVFPLQAELGIEMATQFGGKVWEDGKMVSMGSGFRNWLKAFWPTSTEMKTLLGDQRSTEGNMLGNYTMALSWLPKTDWSVKAYYEHFFEDQSQMTFEYGWRDGLWGIQAQLPRNPFLTQLVYEYLTTKDQTGAVNNDSSDKVPEQVSGRDNYYNHSLYAGWQHWGMTLGNPLVISPVYNDDHILRFRSNRVQGHHFGLSGNPLRDVSWRMLLSFTRNWGSYAEPLPEVQTNLNWLAELSWSPHSLKGWQASIGLAGNAGSLLGHSLGVMLTVSRHGLLKF